MTVTNRNFDPAEHSRKAAAGELPQGCYLCAWCGFTKPKSEFPYSQALEANEKLPPEQRSPHYAGKCKACSSNSHGSSRPWWKFW